MPDTVTTALPDAPQPGRRAAGPVNITDAPARGPSNL
jgi:hypothetical protein